MRNLLHTIEANLSLFDEPNFRERLKGNPFIGSLVGGHVKPDPAQLDRDIARVSDSDPQVKKLIAWRNNFLFHRSSEHVFDSQRFATSFSMAIDDIETLINDGLTIANRYSILFNATAHASRIIGKDDYLRVLRSVRKHVQNSRLQIEEDRKRLRAATAQD